MKNRFLNSLFGVLFAAFAVVSLAGFGFVSVASAADTEPSMIVLSGNKLVEGEQGTIRVYKLIDGIPQRADLPVDWNIMIWNETTLAFTGSVSNGKIDHAVDIPDGLDDNKGIYVFDVPDYGTENDYEVELRDESGIVIDIQNFTVIKDLNFHVDGVSMSSDSVGLAQEVQVTVSGSSQIPGAWGFSLRLPSDLPEGWYLEVWHYSDVAVTLTGSTKDGYIEKDQFGETGVYAFTSPNTAGKYVMILKDDEGVKVDEFEFNVKQQLVLIENPSVVEIESSKVLAGSPVEVMTYAFRGDDKVAVNLREEAGWDLQVWRAAGIAGDEAMVLSLDGGEISESDSAGKYTFQAPDLNVGYEIRLINSLGNIVSSDNFSVIKLAIKIPDLTLDLPEIVFEIPDELLLPPSEEETADEICVDVDADFWAVEMMTELLGSHDYPVVVEGDDVYCRPVTAVTRKEFTMWLLSSYRSDEIDDVPEFHEAFDYEQSPFSDVDGSDSYDPYIIRAYQLGIINGHPDGTFKGDEPINRAEVLKILLRSSGLYEDTEAERANLVSTGRPDFKFEDVTDETVWFYGYLHYATQPDVQIIEGRLYPMGNGETIRKADMGEPVLFSEAGKILYLAQKFEAEAEAE